MSSDDNVVELGRNYPTVASVIGRLQRQADDIENVLVFIEYKDKSCTVAFNTMSSEMLAYGAAAMSHRIHETLFNEYE